MINSLTGRSGKLPTGCKLNYTIATVELIIGVMPQCYVGYTICVGACVHVCLCESAFICICVLHTNDIMRVAIFLDRCFTFLLSEAVHKCLCCSLNATPSCGEQFVGD